MVGDAGGLILLQKGTSPRVVLKLSTIIFTDFGDIHKQERNKIGSQW